VAKRFLYLGVFFAVVVAAAVSAGAAQRLVLAEMFGGTW
jgi:hypothetical protein